MKAKLDEINTSIKEHSDLINELSSEKNTDINRELETLKTQINNSQTSGEEGFVISKSLPGRPKNCKSTQWISQFYI